MDTEQNFVTLEVTVQETKDVQVQLPCYTKRGYDFYFVDKDKTTTNVCTMDSYKLISKHDIWNNAFLNGYEIITKEEFETAFNKVKEALGL